MEVGLLGSFVIMVSSGHLGTLSYMMSWQTISSLTWHWPGHELMRTWRSGRFLQRVKVKIKWISELFPVWLEAVRKLLAKISRRSSQRRFCSSQHLQNQRFVSNCFDLYTNKNPCNSKKTAASGGVTNRKNTCSFFLCFLAHFLYLCVRFD